MTRRLRHDNVLAGTQTRLPNTKHAQTEVNADGYERQGRESVEVGVRAGRKGVNRATEQHSGATAESLRYLQLDLSVYRQTSGSYQRGLAARAGLQHRDADVDVLLRALAPPILLVQLHTTRQPHNECSEVMR